MKFNAQSGWRYWIDRFLGTEDLVTFASPKVEITPGATEKDLVVDCLLRVERAARMAVCGGEMSEGGPNTFGRGDTRVPGHYMADLVEVLAELQQISDYYRAPIVEVDDEGNPKSEARSA